MSVVASSIVYFTSDAYETSIVLMMSIVIAESAAETLRDSRTADAVIAADRAGDSHCLENGVRVA